ncbi:MAG TPA: MucR family transcriptional regulator [Inquilinus sp.]
MTIDQAGKATAMPDDVIEATVAIVAAHLRMRATSAAQVPGLIQQVHKTLTDLVDQGSRDLGPEDQQLSQVEAPEPSRSDRLPVDAELRRIAEQGAVFPWSGWPGLRGPRAGTRIGESPRERFRSRCR